MADARQSRFQKGSSVLTKNTYSHGRGGGRVVKDGGWWVQQSGATAVASVPERSAWALCVALCGSAWSVL